MATAIEADYKHIAADVRSRIVKVAKSNGWGKTTRPAATSAMTRPTTSRATINNFGACPVEAVQLNLL
jgi:hypothetical protein